MVWEWLTHPRWIRTPYIRRLRRLPCLMVNKPLVRPYFLGYLRGVGWLALLGGFHQWQRDIYHLVIWHTWHTRLVKRRFTCAVQYIYQICVHISFCKYVICVFICTYIHLSKFIFIYIYILCDVVANEHGEAIPMFDSNWNVYTFMFLCVTFQLANVVVDWTVRSLLQFNSGFDGFRCV